MEEKTIKIDDKKSFMGRFNTFLMKDNVFILLVMGAAAAIFAGTYMYVRYNTGIFSDLTIAQMLRDGLDGGDFTAAAGFATGFLIARILEGPLVGVLDIGGSLMTGVGIGIPAVLLSMNIDLPFKNLAFSLIFGAVVGLIIGLIIMGVRKTMPEGVAVGGTEVMMGAGNASGRYLGPLIVIAAAKYNVYTGIGAIIGAALFYKMDKQITGGAILGAMILGALMI